MNEHFKKLISRLKKYLRRLLFPVYLFPVKLATYSFYYFVKFLIKLLWAFVGLIFDCIVYPFKSFKNFWKSAIIVVVVLYLFVSLFVIVDYLTRQYGWWGKFFCAVGTREKLENSVVRVVGGYSEGSGFFIADNQILTNFHVIAGEPSPKIIFSDGKFITPVRITGDKTFDLALIYVSEKHPEKVMEIMNPVSIMPDEPLIAAGYALGTDLKGKPTILEGRFADFRVSKKSPVGFIQANINLVKGMSGGPLVDNCGKVVGINTLGLSGLSLFIEGTLASKVIPNFTDMGITKINVDPAKSPAEAVKAFYTYLKARRMEDGFKLLSQEYLKNTNFEEWTNRFKDILDVDVIKTEARQDETDLVFVKFSTRNWIDNEAETHYYEGVWRTVLEDGVYKMLRSNILEVSSPGYDWYR